MRYCIRIDRAIGEKFRNFVEKKYGFRHGAVKAEVEKVLQKHIRDEGGAHE